MRNLIVFLWRHQFFVFFIILEAISLTFLFNSYSYHRSLAFNSVNDITGTVYLSYSKVTDYFGLKKENEKLTNENVHLRNLIHPVNSEADSQLIVRHDNQYFYRTAKVISSSINKQSNYLLLNKGSKHGIKPEMGVISTTGIAGIVIGVSPDFSYVMSLLHQNCRISARIKKNNNLVNVLWGGNNYKEGMVVDIPSHIELYKEDSIITSGNSLIFPEGILIGRVNEYTQSTNKDLSEAVIEFSTDFNSLQNVYIIENLMKTEADTLISAFTN